jgi:UDP:flavonoid glycosyltransferase YjiC (YdhE family)
MIDTDPARTVALVAEALERAGRRGVLLGGRGPGVAAALPPQLYPAGPLDHEWLFARSSAVVHYAPAGTTAATLRAGIPSVAVPHMTDQFLWARRLHELGVAPAPIPRRELMPERLAEAIRAATGDDRMRSRAAALGERIRAEDGVARAVEAFDRVVATRRSHRPSAVMSIP